MRILVADDDSDQRTLLEKLIHSWGHRVETASDGAEALERLAAFAPNVLVTDLKMPGIDGHELMRRLRAEGTLPPTIVLTAFGSVDLAVETVHDLGGFWFLEKPVEAGAFHALLNRAGDHGRLAADNERLRLELSQKGVVGELVGKSAAMQSVFALIHQVAPTEARVLITGESGVGKELTARAIHSFSARSGEPFLAINCAAMPDTLIESELFGHEKGAFTGAFERRQGALELSQGGTLFLDEIGEMPVAMQVKLLRVLEDFRFRRIGGAQEMLADIRLISATNRAPDEAIREGKLREDLYYRLNVFRIDLPPLRDRLEDVPLIAGCMIEKLNQKHGTRVTHLDAGAISTLLSRRWEGNVRELRNTIERAVILAREGPLLTKHLEQQNHRTNGRPKAEQNGLDIRVGMSIGEAERSLIEATLRQAKNNKTRAATVLGISVKTLHAKLKQYRIEESAARGEPGAEAAGA